MKTGLFFGSFNPVHIGHLIIANFMATQTDLEEVWIVVTPQNPHKERSTLANDYDRLHLVRISIENNPSLKASKIEFELPKPSYTIDTLAYLKEQYTNREFVLIMGSDNLASLHKWKNHEKILSDHSIYVYRRPAYEEGALSNHPRITLYEAPLMNISASYIRSCIKDGHSIKYLVGPEVLEYLESSTMYR